MQGTNIKCTYPLKENKIMVPVVAQYKIAVIEDGEEEERFRYLQPFHTQ